MSETVENKLSTSFVGDTPIDEPTHDKFRRWPFAKRIAETIAARRDPYNIVIGIYGAWGEGKTTVLNFIDKELQSFSHIISIRFNPWRFGNENQLLTSFFQTLAASLDRTLTTTKEEIGKAISKYAKFLAPVPGGASDIADKLGEIMSSVEIDELKMRLEKCLDEEKKRVVIFMDDIDRLNKSEIQAVFRLIKLSADFKYVVYILAFDKDMVAAALQEQYPSSDKETGHNFLEKIIQVPLNIPIANQQALEKICFESIDEALRIANIGLDNEQVSTFQRHFYNSLTIRLKTPRIAKRYANALTFALPILKGEVNPIDLMLIEGIRIFYPSLYANIRDNSEAYLCTSLSLGNNADRIVEEYKEIRQMGMKQISPSEQKAVQELIAALFPRTKNINDLNVWNTTWAKEQRVASIYYFNRYFSYAIPEGDVADTQITLLLSNLDHQEINSIVTSLGQLLETGNEEAIIRKITNYSFELSPQSSIKLAACLAIIAQKFPNPDNLSLEGTPMQKCAILISKLMLKLPMEVRCEFAEQIVKSTEHLPFAFECVRWFHSSNETSEEEKLFNREEEEKLARILTDKIYEQSTKQVFYLTMPRYSSRFYSLWAEKRSRNETDEYLSTRFKENPLETIAFLMSYLPTEWIAGENIPRKGNFQKNHYDAIASVIEPETINSILNELYGKEISASGYVQLMDSNEPLSNILARQFVYIHRITKEKQEQSMKSEDSENEVLSNGN